MTSTDRYTKIVLTLIALALIVIAARPLMIPAPARGADLGPTCGLDPQHPCYVTGFGPGGTVPVANSHDLPLKVLVTNATAYAVPVIISNPPTPLSHPLR